MPTVDDPLNCHTRLKADQQQVEGYHQAPIMHWEEEEEDFRFCDRWRAETAVDFEPPHLRTV